MSDSTNEVKVSAQPPTLPAWLTPAPGKPGVFNVDPDKFYPEILDRLQAAPDVPYEGEVDQYWLEVAYQCMKLDAQLFLRMSGLDPRPQQSLVLNIDGGSKDKWAQKRYKPGRLERLAALGDPYKLAGKEAREYYVRMRGFLPQ